MTRKAFWLIAAAYAILALGMIVSLYLFKQQADDIKDTNKRLIAAAAAYCQAGIQPDAKENQVLDQLSRATYHPGMLDPICLRIVHRLEEGGD